MPTRLRAAAARRPTAAVALLYAVLSLLMFSPGLVPGRTLSASDFLYSSTPWESVRPASVPLGGSNPEEADSPSQFLPALQRTRAALPHIPTWDPYMLGGRPYVADPQSQVFSPFSLPSYLLPFWMSLAVAAALKVFVASFGAYLLGRQLGMRIAGALLCGLAFGFSPWVVSWVSWTLGSVWVFAPWVWLTAERCLRAPAASTVAALAAVVGLQFLGGHPSSSFQVLVVLLAFVLVRTLARGELRPGAIRRLGALALGLLGGAALAALMLIPFLELLSHSSDLQSRQSVIDLFHQDPRYLLGTFLRDYWGHGQTSQVFGSVQAEHAYYVGALTLMLGAAALILRPRLERLAVALLAVLALLAATGLTPLYSLLVKLPGFDAANNGRLAVIAILCVAVLAGWGLDELTAQRRAGRAPVLVAGASALLLLLPVAIAARHLDASALGPALRTAFTFATPDRALAGAVGPAAVLRLASILEWLLAAGLALGLILLRSRGRLGGAAFATAAVVLLALDLFRAGVGNNPSIPVANAKQPETPALRYLQTHTPARMVGLSSTAPNAFALPLTPNTAMPNGILDGRGYVQPAEERHSTLWRQAIADDPRCYYFFCLVQAHATPRALRGLGAMGVGELLQRPVDRPLRGLRVLYSGPDARIYANPDALPRASLVDRQAVVPSGAAALAAVTAPDFARRDVAVTEHRLPGLRDASATSSPPRPGTATLERYAPERVEVRTAARAPALLVLTDAAYPGWKATVDGRTATIHRVDYLNRGILVPAGTHSVRFRYEPLSWRVGWIVSLLTLVALLTAALLGRRRSRARAR